MAKWKAMSQIDSLTKVKNLLNFLMFWWRGTYYWKAFDEGYKFALDLTSIGNLHTKLWASKVAKDLILGISGLSFGSPKTKWHLSVGPVVKHKEYNKGEGGCFPQVWAMVSLVTLHLHVAHPCIKGVPTTH
jgi:hypothetical protein